MADVVLLEKYVHLADELFRISSGVMRFKLKGTRANFWLVSEEEPYRELYQITIGPTCYIRNIQSGEHKIIHIRDIINNEDFTEFWVSFYNYKVRLGYVGQYTPILEFNCVDQAEYHKQIGYIKFNSPDTRFQDVTWLIEAPPVLYISPSSQKLIEGGELHWMPMASPSIPCDAMIGGFEDEPTYIARAFHNHSLCPGRYIPSRHIALIPWGLHEHEKHDFEILCGFNAKWVKTKDNDIPQNAFVAGYSEVRREPLYIGRAMHNGHLLTGKVHVLYKSCYLPYNGREISVGSYEILVLTDRQRHVIFNHDASYDE